MNPNTVTTEITAPSKVMSKDSHLPIVPPTPVCVVADMLKEVTSILMNDLESDDEPVESDVEIGDESDENPFFDGLQQPPTRLTPILEGADEGEGEGDYDSDGIEDKTTEIRLAKAGSADSATATQTCLIMADECIRKAVKRLGESVLKTYVASQSVSNPILNPISITLEAALSI